MLQWFVNLVPIGWSEVITAALLFVGLLLAVLELVLAPGTRGKLLRSGAIAAFLVAVLVDYASQQHEQNYNELKEQRHDQDVTNLNGNVVGLGKQVQSDHVLLTEILSHVSISAKTPTKSVVTRTTIVVTATPLVTPSPKPTHAAVVGTIPSPERVTPLPQPPVVAETPVPGPHLQYTVKKTSSRSPYTAEITIQTDRDIEQPSIVVVFDRSVKLDQNPDDVDLVVVNGSGISTMLNRRISVGTVGGGFPAVLAQYSGPAPFEPETPLVMTVSSATPISVLAVLQGPR